MITGAQVLEQGLFNKLKGSFAHKLDGEGEIANQCTVLQTKGKLMEVQYYDWFIGAESERGWVSQLEFDAWVFWWCKQGVTAMPHQGQIMSALSKPYVLRQFW